MVIQVFNRVLCKLQFLMLNLAYETCIKTMEINPMDGVDDED